MQLANAIMSGKAIMIRAKKFWLEDGEQVTRPIGRGGQAVSFYKDHPLKEFIRRA